MLGRDSGRGGRASRRGDGDGSPRTAGSPPAPGTGVVEERHAQSCGAERRRRREPLLSLFCGD